MKTRKLVTLLAAVAASHGVWATNGTMPHGYGIKAQGMGGVGIALPQDAVAAANNPAGMVSLGERLDIGLAAVLPNIHADIRGTDFNGGGVKAIPIPELGYNHMLDARRSVGVSVYGNGVTTKYDANISGGPNSDKDGSNLMQIVISPSFAIKLDDVNSIGVALNIAYQDFKITGVPDGLGKEDQGHDSSWGYGLKLGWLGQLTDRLSLGVQYTSKTKMGKLDKYRNLLAGQGEFDIPENYGVGVAFKVTPALTVAADYLRINWGDIKSLGNHLTSVGAFGADNGPGFGWKNQNVARIGLSYAATASTTLRAGYSHGSQIVPTRDTTLNYLAPVTPQDHLTLGGTWAVSPAAELSAVYGYAIREKVSGSGASTGTDVAMGQHWIGIAYGMKF